MDGMTTITKSLMIVFMSLAMYSCKKVDYIVGSTYTGPCVIFVCGSSKVVSDSGIVLKNGLGYIDKADLRKRFVIRPSKEQQELSIVEIGQEELVKDSGRHVFQLGMQTTYANCSFEGVNAITFFIGNKYEYNSWSNRQQDVFDYFTSIGIDWCGYYKHCR